jgi:hypothetical protein
MKTQTWLDNYHDILAQMATAIALPISVKEMQHLCVASDSGTGAKLTSGTTTKV